MFISRWLIITRVDTNKSLKACVHMHAFVYVCIPRWPCVSIFVVCVRVFYLCRCVCVCECKLDVFIPTYLCVNILQGMHCHRVSILCVYISLTLSACLCLCMSVFVCVHSDEAGEAAWRLIHHFPPWPAVPSEERCAVTVTLGSFWSRKMVHPPPASPPKYPPPSSSSQPACQ